MKRSKELNAHPHVRLSASTSNLLADGVEPRRQTDWRLTFRRHLLKWFRQNGRELPWRGISDPYAIWISEIMLQQTQVATVVPYYGRFLKRFPTVTDLAAADEQDVLRLWEGLGYYRRARQLHAAARQIMAGNGSQFPADFEAARRLPGIGRYTAGAILSFAFDMRLPILEANTVRLWARLLAYRGDPLSSAGQALLWSAAESVLPRRGSGQLNQALMDLGSQVCLPRQPRCDRCPVRALCKARAAGLVGVIPTAKLKPKIEHVCEAAVVVRDGKRVLLVQYGSSARWAGLWDFPRFAVAKEAGPFADQVATAIVAECKVNPDIGRKLATLRHGVTRFRITLEVFEGQLRRGKKERNAMNGRAMTADSSNAAGHRFAQLRWAHQSELADYPLNTTGRKIARLVEAESIQ